MNNERDLQPGDIVSVQFAGVLRHYGVVIMGGRILSNNGDRGGVIAQTYAEFAQGRDVTVHPQKPGDCEYLTHERAYRRLGHDYDLTGSNCVHYVRYARGRKPTVTQYVRGAMKAFGDMFGPRRERF